MSLGVSEDAHGFLGGFPAYNSWFRPVFSDWIHDAQRKRIGGPLPYGLYVDDPVPEELGGLQYDGARPMDHSKAYPFGAPHLVVGVLHGKTAYPHRLNGSLELSFVLSLETSKDEDGRFLLSQYPHDAPSPGAEGDAEQCLCSGYFFYRDFPLFVGEEFGAWRTSRCLFHTSFS